MININFLEPKFIDFRTPIIGQFQPERRLISVKRTIRPIAVFALSFVVLFVILNLGTFYGSVNWPWQEDRGQELQNERLTAELRSVYGDSPSQQKAGQAPVVYQLPVQNQKAVAAAAAIVAGNQNYIYIPRLNIKAPIILGVSSDAKDILNDLKKGVELYKGSSLPGQGGTSLIIGHSSSNYPWTKYSAIFAGLSKLQAGDVINISYGGKEYVYHVNFKKTGSVADLANSNISGDLILGSCWPVGTDKDRILVSATLDRFTLY